MENLENNSTEIYNETLLNQTCIPRQEEVSEASVSGEILLMMLLLSLSLGGGHYLRKFKIKFINEHMFATIVGLIAGMILTLIKNEKYINNITNAYVKFFLILLLPAIIFESAYNMKKKEFFKNLGTILIYAFLGTFIAILFTALTMWGLGAANIITPLTFRESMAYGSLISSTDPVSIIASFKEYKTDPNFFQIIFGESILNDVVGIVLYETCLKYSTDIVKNIYEAILEFIIGIFGSILLGYAIGFLTAIFLKTISTKVKKIEKIEISLMAILPWVSYLSAQMLGLSGIVSLLFNGIAHATYTKPNLTDWSKITIHTTYESVSNLFEMLIFIFLGIGYFSFQHLYDQLSFPLVSLSIIIILTARFLNVFVCSKIANWSRTETKLDGKKQFFLWFAGVRGSMAFALSVKSKIDFPNVGPIFLVLTLIIISFSLLYSAIFLETTLHRCDIIDMCEADNFDESILINSQSCFHLFKQKINDLNNTYMMPCVKRDTKIQNSPISINLNGHGLKANESDEKKSDENKVNNKQDNNFKDDSTLAADNIEIKNKSMFE